MGGNMFDGLGAALVAMFVVCCIAVPLALWKVIDIAFWIAAHVSVHAAVTP
jgi:hypothetical protein